MVWHSSDDGRDDLGVFVGVAAHLVLATVNFAAQRRTLHEDIFEPEPEALVTLRVRRLG
jgi:hypothetical protein